MLTEQALRAEIAALVAVLSDTNGTYAGAEALPEKYKPLKDAMERRRRALLSLIDTIDSTGGIIEPAEGMWYPAADEDWVDLAEAYVEACAALDTTPKIIKEGEDGEDQDDKEDR